jgi:hypothetical protein
LICHFTWMDTQLSKSVAVVDRLAFATQPLALASFG